jgi:hypothetical protein
MIVATLANPADLAARERKFFFIMAVVMALAIVAGFATNLALGRSSFSLPPIFHIHAFVFFGWVALYLVQNGLVVTGNVATHRRLGMLALAWIPLMVGLGLTMTIVSARRGAPFFFDVNEFIFGNSAQLLIFAGLAGTAFAMRRRPDWHRRLMYCGMAILTGPGIGRLSPAPLLIPWAWWVVVLATLIFPLIGVAADLRRTGKAHPAWFWGMGAVVAALLIGDLIAYSSFGIEAIQSIVAGTPGANRPMHAFLPSFPS